MRSSIGQVETAFERGVAAFMDSHRLRINREEWFGEREVI